MTGYVLDKFFNLRLWDYNNEILNFGNINGYICARSVLLFGLASLLLVYVIIPFLKRVVLNTDERKISIFSITLWSLLIIDMITYIVVK